MPQLRPFHETIVDAISDPLIGPTGVLAFGDLLRMTKILENHDAIAEAWTRRLEMLGFPDNMGTATSILAQKPKPMTEEEMIKDTLDRR